MFANYLLFLFRRRLLTNETLAEALTFFDRATLDRLTTFARSRRLAALIDARFVAPAPAAPPYRLVDEVTIGPQNRLFVSGGDGLPNVLEFPKEATDDPTVTAKRVLLAHIALPKWVRARRTRIEMVGFLRGGG